MRSTSVLPQAEPWRRQNSFPPSIQIISGNPWGPCAPRDRSHHNGPHDIKDIHSCSRFLSYFYAVVGPSSARMRPRASARTSVPRQNLGAGGIHFRRAIKEKNTGSPAGRRPVGRRTHFEGMKATIDLVALYLELD